MERWQLLAGVCARGVICGVTALSWCWKPLQPRRDIWDISAGVFGRAALGCSSDIDDLPEAAAAWEAQRWCSKRIITRTGLCMAKAVPVDVQEGTTAPQWVLPGWADPSLAAETHPSP